ncbi:MAG: DUF2252 domain-containing protein [Lachnospiraceae bacterium]|nr:DUF2252 domain-containing protein [Lachnospiraceae bacterium]
MSEENKNSEKTDLADFMADFIKNGSNGKMKNIMEAYLGSADPEKLKAIEGGIFDDFVGHKYHSREDSIEIGKSLRKKVKRSSYASWEVKKDRTEIVHMIEEDEKTRIPELIPVRHERMGASAFAFYRGTANIMARDLSEKQVTGIRAQLCGDAHISNFGFFASPERRMVFDINDFDETLRGPWEWDLMRLLTSIEICGRDRGFTEEQREVAVREAAQTYHKAMQDFSEMGNLDVWYARTDVESLLVNRSEALGTALVEQIKAATAKAMKKDSTKAIARMTETVNGFLRIKNNPPYTIPLSELPAEKYGQQSIMEALHAGEKQYRLSLPTERRKLIDQYEIVDMALKTVGVGSVGLRNWIVVLEGRPGGDYLVLQIKQAKESALEAYAGKSPYLVHGRRVVEGQHAIQATGDIFLGWMRMQGTDGVKRDFYVRQLWNSKGSLKLDDIDYESLIGIGSMCAWTLARAHARTGDRHAIASYIGKSDVFDQAMIGFAKAYADQNEYDYEIYKKYNFIK